MFYFEFIIKAKLEAIFSGQNWLHPCHKKVVAVCSENKTIIESLHEHLRLSQDATCNYVVLKKLKLFLKAPTWTRAATSVLFCSHNQVLNKDSYCTDL